MDKWDLSERDICTKLITPAIMAAGWASYLFRDGDQARAVLEALLDKYTDHGIAGIEDPDVLQLPPFDRLGGKSRIRRGVFADADQFSAALTELERQLYKESA
jgi:type I restriction enzyme R subunit